MTGGSIPAMLVGAFATSLVANNLVNIIYYACVPENPNNEIKLYESSQQKKSYYVDNGYVNRWERLKFIKSKNGSAFYDYNAWHDYAEYSLHMYAWLFSEWAYKTEIPLFNMIAEHSKHTLFGYNTFLIEVAIYLLGYLGV